MANTAVSVVNGRAHSYSVCMRLERNLLTNVTAVDGGHAPR